VITLYRSTTGRSSNHGSRGVRDFSTTSIKGFLEVSFQFVSVVMTPVTYWECAKLYCSTLLQQFRGCATVVWSRQWES